VFCEDFDGFSERPESAPELKPGVERSDTPGLVTEQKKPLPRGDGKIAGGEFRHPLAGVGLILRGWFPELRCAFTPGCTPSRPRALAQTVTQLGTEIEASSLPCIWRIL
jgi:hypothetical protein